ncbi:MAG: hypothetical protein ACKOVA_13065 [Novosphingobium sp.]
MRRFQAFALATILMTGIASPAMAASQPATRLVECGSESCLLVSGRRNGAGETVSIAGHAVKVEGGRKWRVRLPVATVRAWSEPFARTIEVATAGVAEDADLPIGLLGRAENLAMVIVRVK